MQIERLFGIEFSENIRKLIEQNVSIVNFPSHKTVLLEGDHSSCMYIIQIGIVRGYYIDDQGNDITKCFYQEGDIYAYEGFQTELPSPFTIECLENCNCMKIPYNLLKKIMVMDNDIFHEIGKFYKREVH